jgi:predicted transcriptional regulator
MRIRTQLIIADDVLAKIDEIAGEKHRRAIVVETALREYIAREESNLKKKPAAKAVAAKKH